MKKYVKYILVVFACFCFGLMRVNASTIKFETNAVFQLYQLENKSIPKDKMLLLDNQNNGLSQFHFCDKKGVLQVFRIAGVVKNIFKILVPVLLIIVVSIDLGKALISGDDKDLMEQKDVIIKRLVAAVLVFLLPTIIDIILKQISTYNSGNYYNTGGGGEFGKCTLCFASPSESNCEGRAVS